MQKPIAQGALELAKKRGLRVVLAESYPRGTTDFRGILERVKTASPEVLAAATYDVVVITRLLKDSTSTQRCSARPSASRSRCSTRPSAGTRSSWTGPRSGSRSR